MTNQELRITISAKDTASTVIKKIRRELDDSSSAISRGLDQATRSAHGLGGGLDFSAKRAALMGAVAGATVAGITALAHGLRSLGSAAIGGASDFEQSRIAFDTMLGSADKARTMMEDIAKFAKTTPFELPEVVTGAKQLLAYQVEAENIIPTFTMLGNIASAVGRDKMPDLIRAFGQVRAKGKLMAQELNQFAEAGVPLREMLAKELKMSVEQFSTSLDKGKLKIKFTEVQEALNKLGGEGGKWGSLMERQSKTFSGVVSNIKDGIGQVLRSSVGMTAGGDIIAGSFFDRIKKAAEVAMPAVQRAAENAGPAMQNLMEWLDGVARQVGAVAEQVSLYLWPKLQALFNTIAMDLGPALLQLWHNVIEPMMPTIGVLLVGAFAALVDVINLTMNVLTPLINFMASNPPIVYALVAAFIALKGALMLDAAINATILAFNRFTLITIPSMMTSLANAQAALAGFNGFALLAVAAVAATAQVVRLFQALNDVKRLTNEINQQQNNMGAGTTAFYESLKKGVAEGRFTQGEADRRMREYNANFQTFTGRATGGSVAPGKSYVVGEKQAEIFTPNTRGRIQPSTEMGGASKVTNVFSGTININTAEAANAFWDRLDKTQRLSRFGMA